MIRASLSRAAASSGGASEALLGQQARVASSSTTSVASRAASAPRRLASFDAHATRRTAAPEHGRSTSKSGRGAGVERDALARPIGAEEHGRDVAHDAVGSESAQIFGFEVAAGVDVARHPRVGGADAEDDDVI
jgi:hypothetical protein